MNRIAKTAVIAAGAIVSMLLMLTAVAACSTGQPSVNTTADKTATAHIPASKTPAKKAPAKAAEPKRLARVGDSITVHGMDDGSAYRITLVKWADPVHASDPEFSGPDQGNRWVAAQIRITNTGSSMYDDSPSNGMQVADSQGQRFDTAFDDGITAGPDMAASLKLGPGDKSLGWVVFEVPTGVKVTKLQFTADSGFADETAEWRL